MATAWLGALALVDALIAARCLIRRSRAAAAVGAVALGIGFDAAVVAVGATVGAGPALHGLNVGRFVAHLLLTPALIPAVTALATGRGMRAPARVVVVVLTALALAPAVGLASLELEVRRQAGTLRYVERGPAPPLGAVLTVLVVLVVAVRIVRARRHAAPPTGGTARSAWGLLAGVVGSLLLFAVPPSTAAGLLCGALAETVLLGAIAAGLVNGPGRSGRPA